MVYYELCVGVIITEALGCRHLMQIKERTVSFTHADLTPLTRRGEREISDTLRAYLQCNYTMLTFFYNLFKNSKYCDIFNV